jgi:hypothetical protein
MKYKFSTYGRFSKKRFLQLLWMALQKEQNIKHELSFSKKSKLIQFKRKY